MYKKEEYCFNCDTRLPVSRTLVLMVKRTIWSDEQFIDYVAKALREYTDATEKDVALSKEKDKFKEGDTLTSDDIKKLETPYTVSKEMTKFRTSNGCTILTIHGAETLIE